MCRQLIPVIIDSCGNCELWKHRNDYVYVPLALALPIDAIFHPDIKNTIEAEIVREMYGIQIMLTPVEIAEEIDRKNQEN